MRSRFPPFAATRGAGFASAVRSHAAREMAVRGHRGQPTALP